MGPTLWKFPSRRQSDTCLNAMYSSEAIGLQVYDSENGFISKTKAAHEGEKHTKFHMVFLITALISYLINLLIESQHLD